MRSADVEFPAEDGTRLSGTLVLPGEDGPLPASLILSGSGPVDRDSNMQGQVLNVGNAIANALAERGVASLRYDKRGVGRSAGDYLATGFHEETSDAAAALAWLRATPEIDPGRLTVVGHSVGATIAMRLASATPALAGIVLLAGACAAGEEVMRWQTERIAAAMTGLQRPLRGWFRRRQARTRQELLAAEDDAGLDGALSARWLREFVAYDPARDLPSVGCPVLAITGRSDIQVDPDDVERIGALVAGPFTGLTPDGLTHLLRVRPGPPPGLSGYPAQLSESMDAGLLETIATWVSERQAAR